MSGEAIDLTHYEFKHESGEFIVYGTWLLHGDDPEPCLVLMPSRRRAAPGRVKPGVITLSSAYEYTNSDYLLSSAIIFTKSLGMDDNMSRVYKLAELIHSHLHDLITLRPYQSYKDKQLKAVATLKDKAGKIVSENEIKE